MRVVAIIGVLYLALDMFLAEEDPSSGAVVSEKTTKLTPAQKKIADMRVKRKAEKKKAEIEAKQKEEANRIAEEAKLKAEVEANRIAEEEKLKAKIEATRIAEKEARKKAETLAAEEVHKKESVINPSSKQQVDARDGVISQSENQIESNQLGKNSLLVEEEKKKDMVKKALQYVIPPNYEVMGRGLVYNCKGKYWACVSRKSYFQCRKNERWQNQKKKDLECHIARVYATDSDCKTIQKYNINMNAPTEFCKIGK